ncbi:transcription factor mef2A [Musca vetustissima]|uniref:transcription factor mef2A n=1 Tax=Musca vetustissima TaxID=27455 RepID=UPI002AB751A4|nr:transcription factor mef2A [Musca vetustissima]
MDEQLIDEVALHAVIYNRQKYYLNGSVNGQNPNGNKYETKDEAWQAIALKLRSDVETCKKRWKYLRERYVSQRKQGDPPVYEHLSRPYLEKMKFLDQHIQPRKSYRNVPNFLTSPHSTNGSSFNDYNMDSKSNSSLKNIGHFGQHHHFQDQQHAMNALSTAAAAASALEGDSRVKIEADQVFRDFAAAVASQHGQLTPMLQTYNEHFRDAATSALSAVVANTATTNGNNGGLHSSSSSMKSPLSSPLGATQNGSNSAGHSTSTPNHHTASSASANNLNKHFNDSQHEDMDSSSSSNYTKKPRVQLNNSSTENALHHNGSIHHNSLAHNNNHHHQLNNSNNSQFGGTNGITGNGEESDEDSDENSASMMQPQSILTDTANAENPFNSIPPAASPAPSNASSTNALQRSNSTHLNTNTPNGVNQPTAAMFPTNADFLFQLYQQLPQHQNNLQQQQQQHQQQHQQFGKFQVPQTPPPTPTVQRSSEQLLGELVTTELLKMSKERRKSVQKRILEILFFDD